MTERNLVWIKSLGHSVRFHVLSTGTSEGKNVDGEGGGTVCSNGFYADI